MLADETKLNVNELEEACILVVDDDLVTRAMLRQSMKQEGYAVAEAGDGRAALEVFARVRPDIVLIDANMPVMDGFEACARLRALPNGARRPILMLTSLNDDVSVDRAFAAGASDYITKPIHMAVLRQRVRHLLRSSRAERALREREEQLRGIFEKVPIGMAIVEPGGRVQEVNRAFGEMLGYPEAELAGRSLASIVHPRDFERDTALAAELIAGELDSYGVEQRYFKRDREIVWVDLQCIAIRDQAGRITGRLAMIEDITARKRTKLLEEERRRLAYDLHDGVAQVAASAHQHLQAYAHRYRPRRPEARSELDFVVDLGQRVVRETRRIIAGLRPAALDDFGLAVALRMQVDALCAEGWEIVFDDGIGPRRLPPSYETALYRVAQEALANVRKHAETTRVRLALMYRGHNVRLEIQDWGRGFEYAPEVPGAAPGECIGLRGMEDRIDLLGGRLVIDTAPGRGTLVVAEVPLPHDLEGDL